MLTKIGGNIIRYTSYSQISQHNKHSFCPPQNISSHICLIDVDENKTKGEMLDLQHGSPFLKSPKIEAGTGTLFQTETGNSQPEN